MQHAGHSAKRGLRFMLWAVLMAATGWVTLNFAPHRVVLVPCVFMVLFVPMVLLPLRGNRNAV